METNDIGNKYVGMDSSMLMEMAHSKHASESQKVAAVSQQFESVLVKQFLKELSLTLGMVTPLKLMVFQFV